MTGKVDEKETIYDATQYKRRKRFIQNQREREREREKK